MKKSSNKKPIGWKNATKMPFMELVENIGISLEKTPANKGKSVELLNYQLIYGQYCYITDFKEQKVSHIKGVKEFLGYEDNEFTFEKIFSYFHPDDQPVVHQILKAVYSVVFQKGFIADGPFHISHRVRKKDGTFVKVLRQSAAFEFADDGRLISNFSLVSDISFLDTTEKVSWFIKEINEDCKEISRRIRKELKNIFTPRENDVLKYLSQGLNSKAIGEKLKISHHTVDTIRRKMLAKTGCTNTASLINLSHQSLVKKNN